MPKSICVLGLHWSGSADAGSFLAHAFDYDSCHIGFVAARAYSRLTGVWEDPYFGLDRMEVARAFFYGSHLGRSRVWAVGGDLTSEVINLIAHPRNTAPVIVHLRVTDDLLEWAARVRTSKQPPHTDLTYDEDVSLAKAERHAVDEALSRIPDRSITLDIGLPSGPNFEDPDEDGGDAFFDAWAMLAERAVRQLRDELNLPFDVETALQRMDAGGRSTA